jgi:hypothetical protein
MEASDTSPSCPEATLSTSAQSNHDQTPLATCATTSKRKIDNLSESEKELKKKQTSGTNL